MVLVYLLALSGALINTLFFPGIHLFTFAPFLALLAMRKPLLPSLYIAALSGLTYDLLSTQMRFGLYAALFVVLTIAIQPLKNLFFQEKPLALSLFSALIALLFGILDISLLSFFGHAPPFTTKLLAQNLFIMPLLDGLFAFFWFSLPLKVYTMIKRV